MEDSGCGSPTKKTRSVGDVIEEIGYGRSQLQLNVLVNGSWLADGSEALIISAITATLAAEWSLAPTMEGSLSSLVYIGTLIGSLFSGWLGDSFGRRTPILLCFPAIIAFSVLSGCAQSLWLLLLLRFFVGVGFGIGQPSSVAILMEATPASWRSLNQGFAQVAFAVGELFCCWILWIDDPTLQHLHWRWLMMAGAIPALLFFILCSLFLQESPAYLAQQDVLAAQKVLNEMRQLNGKDHIDMSFTSSSTWHSLSLSNQLKLFLRPTMVYNTVILGYVCFAYNLTIYGAFYGFPQLLPHLNMGVTPVTALAVGALIEIPFDFLGVIFGRILSRKAALGVYFGGIIMSAVLFNFGAAHKTQVMLQLGYYGLKGFPQVGSVPLYVYASEVYPVNVRTLGTSIVLGIGRIGAILGPLVYEWTSGARSGSSFFLLAVIINIAGAVLILLLPETYGGFGAPPVNYDPLEEEVPLLKDGEAWALSRPSC